MMDEDKKPNLAVLIGRMRKGPMVESEDKSEDKSDIKVDSAEALMQAIKDDDKDAAAKALEAFVLSCKGYNDSEE